MPAKPYFKNKDIVPPLTVWCERVVRLEEVDALSIVWHGRYPSYLEDGREEMGRRFKVGYMEFKDAGVLLPIRTLHIDYLKPLTYLEKFSVETIFHWHEAARINMEYKIYNQEGQLTTSAYSVQMMVDFSGGLLLEAPAFYHNFQQSWQRGEITV